MRRSYRFYRAAGYAAIYALLSLAAGRAYAQTPAATNTLDSIPTLDSVPFDSIPDSVRQKHMVHVSPHLVVFNPSTRSATLEFSNWGALPTEADVEVQLGYTYWQNEDTVLIPPHGKRERGRDTVIFDPGPGDHYAGSWLSGVPTHIALGPHEKRQVTLRIDPPANLRNGEYYARIVTTVGAHTKRAPVSQDTRQTYNFPIRGWEVPLIRDSVRVFYQKGAQSMGLKILQAKAEIDTSRNTPVEDVGQYPLRTLVQVQLTGTAHFEGIFRMFYVAENGDQIQLTASEGAAFTLHRDGIIRWSAETDHLPPGHNYHVVMRFLAQQDEFPESQRLPMQPVEVELPVKIPAIAAHPSAVSTGQELIMGATDPYWVYVMGVPDYGAADAFTVQSSTMTVDTMYNYGSRKTWNWYIRSFRPEKNVNDGWLHVTSREVVRRSPSTTPNTARTFVHLPNYKGKIPPINGHVWSENRLVDIYVNGKPLKNFAPLHGGYAASYKGEDFHISESDGLVRGENVLDFTWIKYGGRFYVIRVDFDAIFRETHDR